MPKIDPRLAALSPTEMSKAQKKLNALCKSVGIESWDLKAGSGKARWRNLVFSLCDIPLIPNKKIGRPKSKPAIDDETYLKLIKHNFKYASTVGVMRLIKDFSKETGTTLGKIIGVRNRVMVRKNSEIDEFAKNYSADFPME